MIIPMCYGQVKLLSKEMWQCLIPIWQCFVET